MKAKDLLAAAQATAEKAPRDPSAHGYDQAVLDGFNALKADKKDYPVFKRFVSEARQRLVNVEKMKLPSEAPKPATATSAKGK